MAVSRRLRLRGEMERLFSRSFRNAATNGASISSKANREGGLCRRFSVNRNRSRNVSRYESNGVCAGLFLLQQTLSEETLQQTREVGCTLHFGVLQRLSNRSTACPISSGQAVRYQ